MVIGLPMVSCRDVVCPSCVFGKHRDSFDKHASWHASTPLQLVHNGSCGSFPSLFVDFKYFLTLIDDYPRCTWIYSLKIKSKIFDMFMAYKAIVEKRFGHQLLMLRTDTRGKYVNNKFTTFHTT